MARKKPEFVDEPHEKCNLSSSEGKTSSVNGKVLKCSRRSVALKLLKKKKTKVKGRRTISISKCKAVAGPRGGVLPYYSPNVAIQIRNAVVTHNWEAAALLLRILLKIPMVGSYFYRFIWRVFFLIIQHTETCSARMERFQVLCKKVLRDDDFLEALSIPKHGGVTENTIEED